MSIPLCVCKYLLAQMRTKPNARAPDSRSARERTIDAALQVFGEKGFTGSTTREIAKRARVNEVTIFRLFKSKRALYAAAITERSPVIEISKRVEIEGALTTDDLMFQNIKTVLSLLRDNKHLFMVMLGDVWRQSKAKAIIREVSIQRGIEFVTGFVDAQMKAGRLRKVDPKIAARAIMGMVQFYFLTNDLLGDGGIDEEEEDRIIRGFVSIFLDGLRAEQKEDMA